MQTITKETLADHFQIELPKKAVLRVNIEHMVNVKLKANNYTVYSHQAMPELIKQIQANNKYLEEDEKDMARYVVDTNGEMWFALSGRPGRKIPAHNDMCARQCVAAGDIQFSADYTSIISISNQSGHFTPNIGTLVLSIAALRNLNAALNDNVTIRCIDQTNTSTDILLTRDEVYGLLPTACAEIATPDKYSIGVCSDYSWTYFAEGEEPTIDTQPKRPRNDSADSFCAGKFPCFDSDVEDNGPPRSSFFSSLFTPSSAAGAGSSLKAFENDPHVTTRLSFS